MWRRFEDKRDLLENSSNLIEARIGMISFTKLLQETGLSYETAQNLNSIIILILKLLVVFIVWKLIKAILRTTGKKADKDERIKKMFPVLTAVSYICFGIFALTLVLSQGLSDSFKTLLTGSGIAAIALGIACQDTIGNLFAGMVIIITRPFNVGDVIRYVDADIAGTVEHITFRHTIIKTFENKRLIIPNITLSKAALENYTLSDESLNVFLEFKVPYGTPIEKALNVVKEAAETVENVLDVSINIKEPSDSAIVLRLAAVIPSLSVSLKVKSDIYINVFKAFEREGMCFAYPHLKIITDDKSSTQILENI